MDPNSAFDDAKFVVKETMSYFNAGIKEWSQFYGLKVKWEDDHEEVFAAYLTAITVTNIVGKKGSKEKFWKEKKCIEKTANTHAKLVVEVLRASGRETVLVADVLLTLSEAKVICLECFRREIYHDSDQEIFGWICHFDAVKS